MASASFAEALHDNCAKTEPAGINYNTYKLAELKEFCRQRGLKVSGNKTELIDRLTDGKPGAPADSRKRSAPGGPPQVKKAKVAAKPVLLPGLVENIPASAGPWARKSIERWGLGPPYDPSVDDSYWEAYFKERAALEHRLANELCPGGKENEEDSADESEQGSADKGPKAWPHDFPMPSMPRICSESYNDEPEEELSNAQDDLRQGLVNTLSGCPGLPGSSSLVSALDSSSYILSYWVNWEDADEPRTLEMRSRLYAPSGTGMSLDIKYDYHSRGRAYSIEFFTSAYVTVRRAGDCCPAKPAADQAKDLGSACLFKGSYDNSKEYCVRSLATKQNVREWEKALLGRSNAISDRKALTLVLNAAGVGIFHDDNDWCFRLTRRRMKLAAGEESKNCSCDDHDSENVPKKKSRSYSDDEDDGIYGYGGGMPYFGLF